MTELESEMREAWKATRLKAIAVARKKANQKGSIRQACALVAGGDHARYSVLAAILERNDWVWLYSAWIFEMDERYGDD